MPYLIYAFILGNRPDSIEMITNVLYGSIQSISLVTVPHLWFLPCFFLSVVIFDFLERVCKDSKWLHFFAVVVLIILGYVLSRDFLGEKLPKGLPFGLNSALVISVLLYMGKFIRFIMDFIVSRFHLEKRWLLFVLSCLIGLVAYGVTIPNMTCHVNMAYATYGIYPLFYVTVFLMSIAVLFFAKALDNSIFSVCGRFTLPIYAFHLPVLGVVSLIVNKFVHLDIIPFGLLVSIFTLGLTTIAIFPIKRFAPNLAGIFKTK